ISDLSREFRDRVGTEEVPVGIDIRRLGIPLLARRRFGIEDRPDRAPAVQFSGVAVICHAGGEEIVGAVDLVPESLAILIDEDYVLPILHRQARRFGEMEDRAFGLEYQRTIPPATADVPRLRDRRAGLAGLSGRCPERGADLHGSQFTSGALMHIRL